MTTFLDLRRWDPAALAASWRDARPFPHVILDDFLHPVSLQELREAVASEAHAADSSDFFEFMGSATPMQHATLARFTGEMGGEPTRAFVAAITGKPSRGIEMRSYVYLAGSYLLPHSDHRTGLPRVISYAYYLVGASHCIGGELELFACHHDGEEIDSAEPALLIEPRPNRLVIFDVSPVSLHQVREVTLGGRVSLAGWYVS